MEDYGDGDFGESGLDTDFGDEYPEYGEGSGLEFVFTENVEQYSGEITEV